MDGKLIHYDRSAKFVFFILSTSHSSALTTRGMTCKIREFKRITKKKKKKYHNGKCICNDKRIFIKNTENNIILCICIARLHHFCVINIYRNHRSFNITERY